MKEARITGLTIETEHLTARVVIDESNERDFLLGWKCGTSILRLTQDDLEKIVEEISQIDQTACLAMYNQPSAADRKMLEEPWKIAAQVKAE